MSFHPRGGISDGVSARRPRPPSLSPGAGTGSFPAGGSVSEARTDVGDDPRLIRKKAATTARTVAASQSAHETNLLRARGLADRAIPSCGLGARELIHEAPNMGIQQSRTIEVPAGMVFAVPRTGFARGPLRGAGPKPGSGRAVYSDNFEGRWAGAFKAVDRREGGPYDHF
jgi:hypothetical protein